MADYSEMTADREYPTPVTDSQEMAGWMRRENEAYLRGRLDALDVIKRMRYDYNHLPHREFPIRWPDWREFEEVLPSYCGCPDCKLWRSGS